MKNNSAAMDTGRNNKYDNLKLFLILCVIMGHMGNRYAGKSQSVAAAQFWIYLFHMPAFIFISGLFSKRTVNNGKWHKVVPYIMLYLFMKSLNYFVVSAIRGFGSVKLDFFHETGIAWFALSMFWWYTALILLKNVRPAYVMSASILLSLVSGYSTSVGSFLCMQRTIIFFPFFYLGYLINPEWLLKVLSKWQIKLAGAVVTVISIYISFHYFDSVTDWRVLFRGVAAYEKIAGGSVNYAWGFAWRAAAYLISALTALSVAALIPSADIIVTRLGRKTLPVYAFHGTMISIVLRSVPAIKNWLTGSHLAIHCAIFSVLILLITSLPCFEFVTKAIMSGGIKKNVSRDL